MTWYKPSTCFQTSRRSKKKNDFPQKMFSPGAYPTVYNHYRVPSGDVDPRPRAPPLSLATRQDQDVADQESFPAPRKHRSIRAGS